jgi:hypothetical protein
MSTISKGHPGLTQKEITERYNAMIEREKRYNPSFGIINPEDQKEVEKHKRVTDNLMKRASKAECDVDLQTGQTYSSEWLQSVTTEKAPTRYTQSFSGVTAPIPSSGYTAPIPSSGYTAPIPSSGYTAPMSYPSNTKKGGRNRRSKQRRSNQRKLNKRNSLRN